MIVTDKPKYWHLESVISYSDYQKLHRWVVKNLGKASYCSIDKSHPSKRYEWANISGEYKKELEDFVSLCVSCHRKTDYTTEQKQKASVAKLGNTYHRKPVLQYDLEGHFIKRHVSTFHAGKELGIYPSGIMNNLSGRAHTAGGYVWKRSIEWS